MCPVLYGVIGHRFNKEGLFARFFLTNKDCLLHPILTNKGCDDAFGNGYEVKHKSYDSPKGSLCLQEL